MDQHVGCVFKKGHHVYTVYKYSSKAAVPGTRNTNLHTLFYLSDHIEQGDIILSYLLRQHTPEAQ